MILVVGAGPAGLMAAWRAAFAGHEVTLVEKADQVGGMAGRLVRDEPILGPARQPLPYTRRGATRTAARRSSSITRS